MEILAKIFTLEKSESNLPFLPPRRLNHAIWFPKTFQSQWILKTCALALKQKNCKFENYHSLSMYLVSVWVNYITSAEPRSVANKVFRFSAILSFACFFSLFFLCLNVRIAKKCFQPRTEKMYARYIKIKNYKWFSYTLKSF